MLLQCVAVSWCYGIKRAMSDLDSMGMSFNKFMYFYWTSVWTVIVPLGSFVSFCYIIPWHTVRFRDRGSRDRCEVEDSIVTKI